MLNNILRTFFTRILSALLNFLLVILTAKIYGAEGRGVISIVILSATIVSIISSLIGGPALVYLTPRHSASNLILPSYLWAIITAIAVIFFLYLLNLIPARFLFMSVCISMLTNFNTVNYFLLLGKEKIHAANLTQLFQVLFAAIVLIILAVLYDSQDINLYFLAHIAGQTVALLFASYYVFGLLRRFFFPDFTGTLKNMVLYGIFTQSGNIMQLFSYRISYYLLNYYHGTAQVGIYSTGIALSESVWIIGGSLASVQYARISNSENRDYSARITFVLGKLSLWVTIAALMILIFIPDPVFVYLLGNDFKNMSRIILLLSPGMAAMGFSSLLSHYYAGTGRVKITTIASGIGFAVTILIAPLGIKAYGIYGAIAAANLSYIICTAYLFIRFMKETGISAGNLVPRVSDIQFVLQELKDYVRNSRNR